MISSHFRSAVSQRLLTLLDEVPDFVDSVRARELFTEFISPARQLSSGGKRTRALFVGGGFQAIRPSSSDLPLHAAVATEIYQASALVHDDIIDDADTRRGITSTHQLFAATHSAQNLLGAKDVFGRHSALLLGDYLLSLAGEEFARQPASDADFRSASQLFATMTAQTAFGQYMDMRAEFTDVDNDVERALSDAFLVLLHKSARYSVELPVLLGASLAGADSTALDQLTLFARPLGEAFQLRDDELGIFGDSAVTGKPAGSDFSEGKRTVLLALTRHMCQDSERDFIDAHLGKPVTSSQLHLVKEIMISCGAYDRHEELIAVREQDARDNLPRQSTILTELTHALHRRTA
ncbi:polyprenyl synthetase family protein [Arcanobacterium pinnipediorum]|uniref:Polyprenyl synthetase family protein n=1 Tax=Arcanobacterium pinnipediorum TaxID=1503041 RepID=A0ABY5AJS6_9ACTO|nr:polyprenyl synthetase family protein [Arcanobacterium pinnipediorum]USR80112.1 polyprenyl synthetase family protein [Arcanobacterium pinnipediorum]